MGAFMTSRGLPGVRTRRCTQQQVGRDVSWKKGNAYAMVAGYWSSRTVLGNPLVSSKCGRDAGGGDQEGAKGLGGRKGRGLGTVVRPMDQGRFQAGEEDRARRADWGRRLSGARGRGLGSGGLRSVVHN